MLLEPQAVDALNLGFSLFATVMSPGQHWAATIKHTRDCRSTSAWLRRRSSSEVGRCIS